MRWQQLFADLEGQFEQAEASAERAEWGSRARTEIGGLHLTDRLRGGLGTPLALMVRGAGRCSGVLVDMGVDWLLLSDEQGRDVLVAGRAVGGVTGLGRATGVREGPGPVALRMDLRRVLRALARDRATVQVVLDDGVLLAGTVDRVGADYLELAEHALDAPRRAQAVQGVCAVALGAVAVVRTVPTGG